MKTSEVKNTFSVLIPDGESVFAVSVLRCLAQIPGVRTHILSNDRSAPIRFSRHASRFFSLPAKTDAEKLTAIFDAARYTEAQIILPVDQGTIRLLSAHGETLSRLTAISLLPRTDTFDIVSNKWRLAEWLETTGIPGPQTILYQTDAGFSSRLSAIPFPALIKPTGRGNGDGIEFFDNPSTLLRFCNEYVGSEEFIVQTFVSGYDIDCSVLCREGKILAYTIQKGFLGGSHRFGPPAGVNFIHDSSTLDVVTSLVDKLKFSGIAHIDLRYDEQDKQVKVIEINPRFWGSLLGSFIAGVNFPYLACLAGLGVDFPDIEFYPQSYVAGTAAVGMLFQRIVKGDKASLHFDRTSLEFIMRDPLPEVLASCIKVYRKIMRKIWQGR